ncbi:MAG TPA: hypothetical protein VK934_11225 [Fimbriimonas sp.]|nr:hypothetical protein [Fimbriimonas sp.]
MRDDYGDLLKDGVRGKYYDDFKDGVKVVLLDNDVAAVFTDSKQVNDILRALIPTLKRP